MELLGHPIGNGERLFLIAGPCVIEPGSLCVEVAMQLAELCRELGIFYVFKASYDKANRSSGRSYRGPGLEEGLRVLEEVKQKVGVPLLTDVHDEQCVPEVASVVDILQTPAFLVRQTNLLMTVARTGKPVNVKKAQFMAPWEMAQVVDKFNAAGNPQILLCERGTAFGYNNLVSDMRSLVWLRRMDRPVVFDATHSVQLPGALGAASGGQREMVPALARAAVATGVAGIFLETHPDPDRAPSDGPNMWPLHRMRPLLTQLLAIDQLVKDQGYLEDQGTGGLP